MKWSDGDTYAVSNGSSPEERTTGRSDNVTEFSYISVRDHENIASKLKMTIGSLIFKSTYTLVTSEKLLIGTTEKTFIQFESGNEKP